jgi:hypothetical protein
MTTSSDPKKGQLKLFRDEEESPSKETVETPLPTPAEDAASTALVVDPALASAHELAATSPISSTPKPSLVPPFNLSGLEALAKTSEQVAPPKEASPESLTTVRVRESQLRSGVEIYTDKPVPTNFPPLILPMRWEVLEEEASKRNVPLKPLILPVQDAIREIDRELQHIAETGMGRLYVISGVTGSGKTTFLNSLKLFIDGVEVYSTKDMSLNRQEAVTAALASLKRGDERASIVVLEGKEAPGALTSNEIDILLTALNKDFRRKAGRKTLFVIPTTSPAVAQSIGQRAAAIGGMTSPEKPAFTFDGPPRSEYISITDETLRALNESRTLLQYGISNEVAKGIAESSESIGAFMAKCHHEIRRTADSLSKQTASIKRKRIHLWMVFCSREDSSRSNSDIIRSLTFGDSQHVQVKRILAGDSKEARYWQSREAAFVLAAQYLDLRIMYLPVRTAVAIASAYGHKEFVDQLKASRLLEREATRDRAQDSLSSTALGVFLKKEGFVERPFHRGRRSAKHQKQFAELVKLATKDDKIVNSMLVAALRDINKNPENKVATELSLNAEGSLVSDIAVVTPTDIYCIEMKWRSSLLTDGEVIRETVGRVREFVGELPELKNLLEGSLSS